MKTRIRQAVVLLLIVALIAGMVPAVYAATDENETISGVKLFDLASPNYTTYLSTAVSVTYRPNGTGNTQTANIKNLGWHFARINNVPYEDNPLYCIEPHKNYAASTSGNYVDNNVGTDGAGSTQGTNVWYAMPSEYREAIALILLFSNEMWDHNISVYNVPMANNPNVPLRIATQFLIYEIVTGLRNADTFTRNSSNGYTVGNVFYQAGIDNVPGFADCYNTIENNVKSSLKIPSFTSRNQIDAPTIMLEGEVTTITDTNGVLPHFTFTDGNGASFSKNGNTLSITQTDSISESDVFSAVRNIPSADNSTFSVFYGATSTYQTCINLYSPKHSDLNAYFRIQDISAALEIQKTTEDGTNLEGWQFSIFSDSSCSNIISGPHTTDANGKISVVDLSAGTVYVKELGHTDSTINALYSCDSTNPQKVVLTAGETATVSFYNKLNTGEVALVKQTNTGEHLYGWQIGLFFDAACTNDVPGSPFVTGIDGTITVSGLLPGTLYAKEIPTNDPYWEFDTAVKEVQIVANQTATVTFTNTHFGRIKFQKTTNTGNHLGGWIFRVTDWDGNHVGDYTTDENGEAYTDNLPLGRYTVQELSVEDAFWSCELGFHDVTVTVGETVVDEWRNNEQGLGWFYKITNTGENLSGWEITVYSDEACADVVCTVTTGESGKIGRYLNPGIYYAKETGDSLGRFEDEYWLIDDTVYQFEIKPHEETSVTFSNTHYGRLNIRKTMDTEGPLEGWQFRVIDASGKEITGSPFTSDKHGEIHIGNILPGVYKIEELIPEDSLYCCKSENPQTVTVKQGETAEVSFTNALRPSKLTIEKLDLNGEHLAGAKFLLEWSEDGSLWWPIEYSDSMDVIKGFCSNPDVVDGTLTTTESGIIEWGSLHPGLYYRIVELEAPEGYVLMTEPAFEDKLPADDLEVVLRVINCEAFTLPKTGSGMELFFHVSRILCITVCGTMLFFSFRKKRRA